MSAPIHRTGLIGCPRGARWAIHHLAAQLLEHLATIDPEHVRLPNRRDHDAKTLVATIGQWITTAPTRPFDLLASAALPR